MAFRIYVENNHIVVQDLVSDKEFRAASKEALFFKDRVSEDTYNTNGFFPEGLQGVKFSDIVDENETPFVNEQAFIDFFSANTGNFNSGGATPQENAIIYLTQGWTDAPTIAEGIGYNNIGVITTEYGGIGTYILHPPLGKTFLGSFVTCGYDAANDLVKWFIVLDFIVLKTLTGDDNLNNTPIKIEMPL